VEILTREYQVKSEDGVSYTVLEYTTVIQNRSKNDSETTDGPRRYTLRNGKDVHRRADKTFEIGDTGRILREI
jgi:hypothetical protein